MTAPVSFAHPWALWLLLLVLFTVALGRRRSGIRWRVATILRAATLALLALALSGPSVRVAVPGASVVFAVDRSLSITPDEQRAETAVVREALARMRSGDRAGVVTFAGRAALRRPVEAHPAVEDPGPAVDPDATDIGGAIDLAVRMLPPEGVRRVVVLSDGAENRGDAVAAARAARQAGVVLDAVPLVSGPPDEVLVEEVTAPQDVHVGEVYEVRVVNFSSHEIAVSLAIDGIDHFTFSEDRTAVLDDRGKPVAGPDSKPVQRPKFSHWIVGPAKAGKPGEVLILGWHKTADPKRKDNVMSFLVTEYGKGAASKFPTQAQGKVGLITVGISRSFKDGELRPRSANETGFGPDRELKQEVVKRFIDAPHEFVTVRYNR